MRIHKCSRRRLCFACSFSASFCHAARGFVQGSRRTFRLYGACTSLAQGLLLIDTNSIVSNLWLSHVGREDQFMSTCLQRPLNNRDQLEAVGGHHTAVHKNYRCGVERISASEVGWSVTHSHISITHRITLIQRKLGTAACSVLSFPSHIQLARQPPNLIVGRRRRSYRIGIL